MLELVASVKRGDISDCSFSFRTLDDHWSKDQDGSPIRTLKKVSLHDGDVAAVAYPAYPETEIGARAREQVEARAASCWEFARSPILDLELVSELEDFDVKAGPAMLCCTAIRPSFTDTAPTSANARRRQSATVCCAARSRSRSGAI